MPELRLPRRIQRAPTPTKVRRSFPGHRAWVRRHHCCVPGCDRRDIECAHVRGGADGGIGLKPSDRWAISLCSRHHAEQHAIGEQSFEAKYGIDLAALARLFARRSPHYRLPEGPVA